MQLRVLGWAALAFALCPQLSTAIDRQALVKRHNVVLKHFDVENPLSVGNGQFAFTADVTGLQTFAQAYTKTIPLCTLSQWGWHSFPNPQAWCMDRFEFTNYPDLNGRPVGYADIPGGRQTPQIQYLRSNPHRLHLGRIGLSLIRPDGRQAQPNDLSDINQTLDLWNGILTSKFTLSSLPVEVQTICHPSIDLLAVRVRSPLMTEGHVAILLQFPYASPDMISADWSQPQAHTSTLSLDGPISARITRKVDDTSYYVYLCWLEGCQLVHDKQHTFLLKPKAGSDSMDLVCLFTQGPNEKPLPDFETTLKEATRHWNRFWQSGGAIDLSESKDPRWMELERRIVLSQYLTAIQCSGNLPPQETGLTCNSWYGKFHLEMHWWHAAHFALWGRVELLERSMGYYRSILPKAIATAARQGYQGARWPKMTCPSGDESPSTVGPFLIWQQPHPIFYAELIYRQRKDKGTLENFSEIVDQTARFMASYAAWDKETARYVLGPTLQCAQEIFPKDRTFNPTFELTYWRWGLQMAQLWRARMGLRPDPHWEKVLKDLARPAVHDGKYLFTESTPDCYKDPKWTRDHPSVLAALGMLPGPGIDPNTMRRTLEWIINHWNWQDTWGWDYPMIAMTAARVGMPSLAIEALLMDTPKNRYRLNGHNHQRQNLTCYLPGNGGLLYAIAMMAAGWDNGPAGPAPGFPKDGQWIVKWEGLSAAP